MQKVIFAAFRFSLANCYAANGKACGFTMETNDSEYQPNSVCVPNSCATPSYYSLHSPTTHLTTHHKIRKRNCRAGRTAGLCGVCIPRAGWHGEALSNK